MKQFFGTALKKSADAAKSLAAEAQAATRKRPQKEPLPSTSGATKEVEKLGRLSTDIKSDKDGRNPGKLLF